MTTDLAYMGNDQNFNFYALFIADKWQNDMPVCKIRILWNKGAPGKFGRWGKWKGKGGKKNKRDQHGKNGQGKGMEYKNSD